MTVLDVSSRDAGGNNHGADTFVLNQGANYMPSDKISMSHGMGCGTILASSSWDDGREFFFFSNGDVE